MEFIAILLLATLPMLSVMYFAFSSKALKAYIGENYPELYKSLKITKLTGNIVRDHQNSLAHWASSKSYRENNDFVLEKLAKKYHMSKSFMVMVFVLLVVIFGLSFDKLS